MDLVKRVKQILVSPTTEWQTIDNENDSHVTVLTTYVLLLAAIPALASFIGYGLIGYSVLGYHIGSVSLGVRQAIVQYINLVAGVYITALIINLMAETFGSKANFNKAFSLVAYAYTPVFIGGIFYIFPMVGFLAFLASLYGLYLLYIGLAPMMQTPAEKKTSYFVVSLLVMIAVTVILSLILAAIIVGRSMTGL